MRLAERLVAPALDVLLLLFSFWLLPGIRQLFDTQPILMVFPVCLGYLGLCAGIWCLKLIARPVTPTSKNTDFQGCVLGLSGLVYAAFVLGMLIYSLTGAGRGRGSSFMENLPQEHPVLFGMVLILILLWLGLFPASVMFSPRPRYAASTSAAIALRLVGVATVSYMLLLTGAWIQVVFDMGLRAEIPASQRLLLFVVYYFLFLLFYAPPRLLLISIDGDKYSLVSLLVMLAFFIWPLTA